MKKNCKKILVFCIMCFLTLQAAVAALKMWTGAVDTTWSNPGNWTVNGIPGPYDDVVIPAITPPNKYPKLTNDVTVKSVFIQGAIILDGYMLTTSDQITVDATGHLGLTGTAAQKNLFSSGKIILQLGSTITYMNISTGPVWDGPYENLSVINRDKLEGDSAFTVNKAFTVKSGPTTLKSNITIGEKFENNGTFTSASGKTVIFNGTTTSIEGTGSFNFYNLTVSSGTLTYKSDITINGTLTCTAGDFKHDTGNKKVTAAGSDTKIEATTGTPSRVKLYALNIRLGKKLTCSGNIDITGNFTDNGNFVHSSGNIIFDGTTAISGFPGETKFNKLTVKNGTLTANKKIAVSNLEVINTGTLTLGGELTVKNTFTNNGTFNANGNKVTLSPPGGGTVTVTGTSTAANTNFAELSMTGAGGKNLTINNKITVAILKLEGTGTASLLTVQGGSGAEITLSASQTGGKYLSVKPNIPIAGPNKYTTVQSTPDPKTQPYAANWVFENTFETLTWTAGETTPADKTKWDKPKNWSPDFGIPGEDTPVTIPAGASHYPKLESTAKAKEVTVAANAELDLADYTISAAGSAKSTLTLNGTVKMTGTADQKNWFGTGANKLEIKSDSTVVYYGTSAATVWDGTYQNLIIDNKPGISAGNLTVDKTLTVKGGSATLTATSLTTTNLTVQNGITTLNAASTVKNTEIKSGAKLSLGGTLTVTELLKNEGEFDAGSNKVTLAPTGTTVTVEGTGDETKTKFAQFECTAGGKTLNINNKITVATLTLGPAATPPLTINGTNGEIHLNNNTQSGQNLKIHTNNVKIMPNSNPRTIYYTANSSEDDAGGKASKNGWVFPKTFNLVNSFAAPDSNKLYIVIDQAGYASDEFSYSGIKVEAAGFTSQTITHYPTTAIPSTHSCWEVTLNGTITAAHILNQSAIVKMEYFDPAHPKQKKYISDIGINLIEVLYASNSKTVRNFDGSENLPLLTTTVAVTGKAGNNFKLYLESDINGTPAFWTKKELPSPSPPPANPVGPHIIHEYARHYAGAKEFTGVPEATHLKFTIPQNEPKLKDNTFAEFMFIYDGWLPCARSKGGGVFDLDVWKFHVDHVRQQRGGVSILNNVIDPHQGQKCTIQIALRKKGSLTVQVMTLDGAIVKTLERGEKAPDSYVYYWDGTNTAGNAVARGMYFIRIAAPDIDEIRKVLVIRQ